jgi:hypothetical protein
MGRRGRRNKMMPMTTGGINSLALMMDALKADIFSKIIV